jgi:hypothetical protein
VREMQRQFLVFTNGDEPLATAILTLPDGRTIDFGHVERGQSVRRAVYITSAWPDPTASLSVNYESVGSVQEKIRLDGIAPYRTRCTGIVFTGGTTLVFTERIE